jgi:hypothetical protein
MGLVYELSVINFSQVVDSYSFVWSGYTNFLGSIKEQILGICTQATCESIDIARLAPMSASSLLLTVVF